MENKEGYFDFLLFDRVEKIKQLNEKYNLLDNAYIAFSGGKDSCVLSKLIDLALPDNKIPRLFQNTGIEYTKMLHHVKKLANQDDRIVINNSNVKIKKMLEEKGYPFKSKQHSHNVAIYQNNGMTLTNKKYLGFEGDKPTMFLCPQILRYQFTPDFTLKLSDKCCNELKKKPQAKWAKENNKKYVLTGMRKSEGGNRNNLSCISGNKFHILAPLDDDFIETFIKKYSVKLCELYLEPYNFKRTGCKFCPFSLDLNKQLEVAKELLPNEYKQAYHLWGKVFNEYKRIGYRLKK